MQTTWLTFIGNDLYKQYGEKGEMSKKRYQFLLFPNSYICMYEDRYVHVSIWVCICIHVCMCILYVCVCMYVCVRVCMNEYRGIYKLKAIC